MALFSNAVKIFRYRTSRYEVVAALDGQASKKQLKWFFLAMNDPYDVLRANQADWAPFNLDGPDRFVKQANPCLSC